jgi:hypothetical protein
MNILERMEQLEGTVRLLTAHITHLEDIVAELRDELAIMKLPRKPKATKLPFLETMPSWSDITKVRAELFYNEPKQGRPTICLKVFVWQCHNDEVKNYIEGTCVPFFFWMNTAKSTKKLEVGKNLAQLKELAPPDHLIGCIQQKIPNGAIKGHRKYQKQAAWICNDDRLIIVLADGGNDLQDLGQPVELKGERAENAAQKIWYWSRT